eukprot:scaffold669236_cov41-Prasinocladus_malaysianus.AAC.1
MPALAGRGLSWLSACLAKCHNEPDQASEAASPVSKLATSRARTHKAANVPWDADVSVSNDPEPADSGEPRESTLEETQTIAR